MNFKSFTLREWRVLKEKLSYFAKIILFHFNSDFTSIDFGSFLSC